MFGHTRKRTITRGQARVRKYFKAKRLLANGINKVFTTPLNQICQDAEDVEMKSPLCGFLFLGADVVFVTVMPVPLSTSLLL